MKRAFLTGAIAFASLATALHAGCSLPQDEAAQFDDSNAAVRATVISAEPFFTESGTIRTRYSLQVTDTFKGNAPANLQLESPGGRIGDRISRDSSSLNLRPGKSYVLLLDRQPDGSWTSVPFRTFHAPANRPEITRYFRGKARGAKPQLATADAPDAADTSSNQAFSGLPSSVVTSTGYSHDANSDPARFTSCDGMESIPYIVDVDTTKLPTGMNQAAALAAVQEALASWSANSSLRFYFTGVQSLGVAAGSVATTDKVLRIQLHDTYNSITNAAVLGVAGGLSSIDPNIFYGGRIGTQGFQERRNAYVVLNHRAAFMANALNFKQVLTHELGHALGLAHSSENPSEPNAILKGATMYYSASNDGRGTTLTAYDQDRIVFGYPVVNRPPYTVDRLIPGVTAGLLSSLPLVPGCNRIRLQAVDAEGATLTASLVAMDNIAGALSLSGTTLIYTPSGNFLDGLLTELQIAQGYHYGKAIVQFSDGTNLSRAATCQVSSIYQDTTPSDGLPDSWMIANFGTKNTGTVGSGRHPDDDPDKDGLTNRMEFALRTNPNSAASGKITTTYDSATRQLVFTPQRFVPYLIEASATMAAGSWTPRRVVTRFDTTSGPLGTNVEAAVPPTKEYYRVVIAP